MSLDVLFEIEKTSLIYQENPLARVTVINHFDNPVELRGPGLETGNPILRLVEVKSGIELFKKERTVSMKPEYWMLPPGKSTTYEFPLLLITGELPPPEWEISAIVPFQRGLKQSESKPVKVTVAPVTPRSLHWTYVQSGWSIIAYGASVNALSEPPRIVRHHFEIKGHGGVEDARVVADASVRAEPVLSSPPNKTVSHNHWIGWRDGGKLQFTHFDLIEGPLAPFAWEPKEPEFLLAPPLLEDASEETEGRAKGYALVWEGAATGNKSWFQTLQLNPDRTVVPRARVAVNGRPAWWQTHYKSTREKMIVYAVEEEGGVTLYARPWETEGDAAARRLGRWPGKCAGGGSLIMGADEIRGGLVLRGKVAEGAPVNLIQWKLNADGRFMAAQNVRLPWNYHAEIGHCMVRVAPRGGLCALIEERGGEWKLYNDAGELLDLAPTLQQTRLPLDPVFYNDGIVALIAGKMAQGYDITLNDGAELPHR